VSSRAHRAGLLRVSILLAMGLALPAAGGARESKLARCAAIDDANARLACYDALAGRKSQDVAQTTVTPSATATATASAAAPAAAPDPAAAAQKFGLSNVQQHKAEEGPSAIEVHVAKALVDRNRRAYLLLDNGQTWLVTDDEVQLDDGEAVTIRRAALGSFMLTSASHHSFHVRRIN
jgi:hypothetical protein